MPAARSVQSAADALAYPVFVARGLLGALGEHVAAHAPAHRYAVIADATVASLYGNALQGTLPPERSLLLTVPPGEREKTRERWASLTDALLEWGAGRDTTVIAVGGGVVCDLAGFVAATFMRGVPVVQVPTTLLAMVDASVGGKTGVDTDRGKNLVGAFHNPSLVLIDPDTLASLPQPVFRSGLAEMLKHGVLADAAYFDTLASALDELSAAHGAAAAALPQLIADSVRIKASIVAADERESGRRHMLNLGHTIAHAIEQQAGFDMLHGDAVAIGLVVEAEIAERLTLAAPGLAARIRHAVARAGLPTTVPVGIAAEHIVVATHGDKKARNGRVRYALPVGIGAMAPGNGTWSVDVTDDVAHASLLAHYA